MASTSDMMPNHPAVTIFFVARCTHIRDTSNCAAIWPRDLPSARMRCASARWCGVREFGRPVCTPRALAALMPAFTRSSVCSRSNAAMPARIVTTIRPIGVAVSNPRVRMTSRTFRAVRSGSHWVAGCQVAPPETADLSPLTLFPRQCGWLVRLPQSKRLSAKRGPARRWIRAHTRIPFPYHNVPFVMGFSYTESGRSPGSP
jgi:hypothetical protein